MYLEFRRNFGHLSLPLSRLSHCDVLLCLTTTFMVAALGGHQSKVFCVFLNEGLIIGRLRSCSSNMSLQWMATLAGLL